MSVNVIGEHGYDYARYGVSLSYNLSSNYEDWKYKTFPLWPNSELNPDSFIAKMDRVVRKLFDKDNGENKFLEHVMLWIDIDAPRFWWQQFDTYRIGVSRQSESTMHTITKRTLAQEDFVEDIYPVLLDEINNRIINKDFRWIKNNLPEGFLQRREVVLSYKSLRNICRQRQHHRLEEWSLFIDCVLKQVRNPEWLGVDIGEEVV